jgi:hypothetical protein
MDKLKRNQEGIVGELVAMGVIGINLSAILDTLELLPEGSHEQLKDDIDTLFATYHTSVQDSQERLIDDE